MYCARVLVSYRVNDLWKGERDGCGIGVYSL